MKKEIAAHKLATQTIARKLLFVLEMLDSFKEQMKSMIYVFGVGRILLAVTAILERSLREGSSVGLSADQQREVIRLLNRAVAVAGEDGIDGQIKRGLQEEPLGVYVPGQGTHLAQELRRGAGIVGQIEPDKDGRVMVDYEHGREAEPVNFATRVNLAARRQQSGYDTHLRRLVAAGELVLGGMWDGERVKVMDETALARWLGGSIIAGELTLPH